MKRISCGFLFIFSFFLISMGQKEAHYVTLTFDDGPRPVVLEKLLPLLNQEGIKATFFPIGACIVKNDRWIRKLAAEGHEVENHSYSHENLTKIPLREAISDVEHADNLIEQIIGQRPKFFRPPFFAINKELRGELNKYGLHTLTHGGNSIGSLDWIYTHSPEKIIQQIKIVTANRGQKDYVIVFHELENTLKALPEIIRYFRNQGYVFVRLDEFVKLSPKSQI